ncbi:long-chain fatty acid--CoA ligase [Pandoraea terrae]|uniref:Long-chain fatty acid--CoA ligase n=1 Tax=Pandoraea terrae TaxID=1537710 RepID=A0A5E4U3M5_9BURK|nr:AMP-dependent synthetase/ligase [Pandoraea terrae]VVD94707.1 long-chain fatty acid--CoA ligase [Pandoraea terrae]
MASTGSTRAVDALTLDEALRRTARDYPDFVAVRTLDDSVSLTWATLLRRVEAVARGLGALGVGRGGTVAIMMGNRPEFHIVDLAAVTLGATPFSIYLTAPVEQIRYLLTDAAPDVAIVEAALLPMLMEASKDLPGPKHVVVVDAPASGGTIALADLEQSAPDFDLAAAAADISPDVPATLIYTSGTTGSPKGVQLSHRNIMAATRAVEEVVGLASGFRVISWLPAAHIAERIAHHYIPVVYAGSVTCCPNPREILSYLPQVRPTWFLAVPRVWEKLKAGLEAKLAAQPEAQRLPMQQAIQAAIERVRLRQRGEPVPAELEATVAEADRELFSGLRKMLGLDQASAVHVGAAPTPVAVIEYFHALGLELTEGWSLSETCAAGTCNRPGKVRIGTVGTPSPGLELKLEPDGEILVRGEYVMLGYRNAPDKTAEAIDADGWFHTGDIGTLDEDGYLRIVDRKKELIINAMGKNMSPAHIEATLKSTSLLIGQAVCIGEGRPYNTALIVLDPDYAPQWAAQRGIEGTALNELAHVDQVRRAVEAAVQEANGRLARVEQIKRFTIVPGDWLPGGDELTPTMKLKRKAIADKYENEIEAMYSEGAGG